MRDGLQRESGTNPSPEEIRRAARILREGGLVAFPTETVYGLGANTFDAGAVRRIYEAKGRPPTSPVIVHVGSVDQARELVSRWPEAAERLTSRFWPGPLTLVLPKDPAIPDLVTAGLPTVGVRMPNHPIALALLREAGVPIAAPSANLFTRLSPTRAGDVPSELRKLASSVLDGGPSPVGIESTVLSLASERPVLLRPGAIAVPELEAIIGPIALPESRGGAHASPGLHPRHYAPRTPLVLVRGGRLPAQGRGAYLWRSIEAPAARPVAMPAGVRAYGARLYAALNELDREGWDWIAVEEPPSSPEWHAVRDRLQRASRE